ncbi:hypothetical protein, partial [Holospora curviuscula]|uniref:hypothetical protein n=1 Tax=Holospora curviuscula TaxID=1082868 RepID=UPI001A9CA10A
SAVKTRAASKTEGSAVKTRAASKTEEPAVKTRAASKTEEPAVKTKRVYKTLRTISKKTDATKINLHKEGISTSSSQGIL